MDYTKEQLQKILRLAEMEEAYLFPLVKSAPGPTPDMDRELVLLADIIEKTEKALGYQPVKER